MKWDFYLSSVDPGGDTGLSLLLLRPDGFELIDSATVPYRPEEEPPPTQTLRRWHLDHPGPHRLLYENFHLRNTSSAAGTDPTALEVIGGIRQMVYDRPDMYTEVVRYEPGQGKHLGTDEALERLDLHFGHRHAQRHVRDSLRHAVSYLVKRRYLPMVQQIAPRRTTTRR